MRHRRIMTCMKTLLLGLIRLYQYLLSPWIGNQCRFYPTCSEYARQAIEYHGSLKGTWLALKRISRCHPWHPGGIDLVPGAPRPEGLDEEPSCDCQRPRQD